MRLPGPSNAVHNAPVLNEDDVLSTGEIVAGFTALLPVNDDLCRAQVAENLARGFPDIMGPRRHLTVIANGPSARHVDLRAIKGPTLAVNGALKLFLNQGIAPTFWAACDPQASVADFIPDDPPRRTIYLLASKCHPSVFEKLANRDARVWSLTDYPAPECVRIATASSITMSGMWLMARAPGFAFTDFDTHGWDGCFMDGQHHASGGAASGGPELNLTYPDEVIDGVLVPGKTFPTTKTWVAEQHGATAFFQLIKYFDLRIAVHGDGMFAFAQEFTLRATA